MDEGIYNIPKVDEIKIENYGIIEKAEIKFSPNLNIIAGKGATGKTTVLKYLIKYYSKDSDIISLGEKIMLKIRGSINKSTILIDDLLYRLDSEKLIEILNGLASCNRQIIVTLDISQLGRIKKNLKGNINIIKTENFELKNV